MLRVDSALAGLSTAGAEYFPRAGARGGDARGNLRECGRFPPEAFGTGCAIHPDVI
jgi:hypothetical protein